MNSTLVNVRSKKVPTLYEADESKYVGPHCWQIKGWAKLVRKLMHRRAYTRWVDQACSEVEIIGLENLEQLAGPAVFVANHQSHLDTLLIHASLPPEIRADLFYGAAQDRWFVRGRKKINLQPWYQSLVLGNFPILRGGGKRALEHASWLINQGQHVMLFPEGTRSTSNNLGEFKHGATLLARAHEVPIVPIHLHGLQNIRPKGQKDPVKGPARVTILQPLHLPTDADVQKATQVLYSTLNRIHTAQSCPATNRIKNDTLRAA